ncbi:1-deoxyxylulose-5-phosphate synthase YajO-like [Liolophura sinensis]|uniref:1-deoxyxylulose-5-phosphate synthase YajO-like n=1 Tax=Liolophura sinensis TaxID=3198878 RepID=UPI0031592DF7
MSSPRVLYNYLGNSGLKVSNICLGTMTFGQIPNGRPSNINEQDSHAVMDKYAEMGGNFLDTADIYQTGLSEQIVGTWLKKQDRGKYVVATKVRGSMDPSNPNAVGLSRKHIMSSIEKSLERLQTDYVDLYQIHVWDSGTPLDETLLALNDLVRAGKVRYLGASNICGWQLQKIADYSKFMGLNRWVSLQQHYCLLNRESEFDVFDVCAQEGVGIIPWSPLKGGLLSGKYKRDAQVNTSSRLAWVAEDAKLRGKYAQSHPTLQKFFDSDQFWKILGVVEDVAKEQGRSAAQVSLKWLLQQKNVPSVIIGATNIKQLEENMAAGEDWNLTPEQLGALNAVSDIEYPYPFETIVGRNADRVRKQ